VYRALELNLRIKPKKRLVRETPRPLTVPAAINEVWSMDFMHDQRRDGRSFRAFNVLEDFNRDGLTMAVDVSRPAARVVRALDQLIEWRGVPKVIRSDNGPEYISETLRRWAIGWGIQPESIQPGNPQQNAYVSNATTGRSATTGSRKRCSTALRQCGRQRLAGSGRAITNDLYFVGSLKILSFHPHRYQRIGSRDST
jgi:hypothetical protein